MLFTYDRATYAEGHEVVDCEAASLWVRRPRGAFDQCINYARKSFPR